VPVGVYNVKDILYIKSNETLKGELSLSLFLIGISILIVLLVEEKYLLSRCLG
jgi:hypothetical protein